MRATMTVVLLTLALAGSAFAQCGMAMQGGPMASMMGGTEMAAWGGFIYVLQGAALEKRDLQGNVVKTVELTDVEQSMTAMERAGICPICGMDMAAMAEDGACPMMGGGAGAGRGMMHGRQGGGMMQRPGGGGGMMHGQHNPQAPHGMTHGQSGGGGMMMGGGCPMMGDTSTDESTMAARQKRQMRSCVRLSADSEGVYLLRGGRLTVFTHDLERQGAWEVDLADCPANRHMRQMARQRMMASTCPHCRMHMGAGMERLRRSIPAGSVEMWHHPKALTAGPARIHLQVFDGSRMPDADAQLSAFLYPEGDTGAGMGLTLMPLGAAQFYALTEIPAAGSWELAVRVMRPGMEDALVYYNMSVR